MKIQNNKMSGGPAFPVKPFSVDTCNWSAGSEGMTLRQWYAGKALVGLLSDGYVDRPKALAASSFRVADAMIAHEQNES